MAAQSSEALQLTYHGRIIDHLGIQMYQSPVAAIAELISNSWDADAEKVEVSLPEELDSFAEIMVKDDGLGMTFEHCRDRYLNVGWCRRGSNPDERSPEKSRPILGRKGIGKFAGFGIAEVIEVHTVSKATGEETSFRMNLNELRGEEYASKGGKVQVLVHNEPNASRKRKHGTTIKLLSLKLSKRIPSTRFALSMSRRFLLHQEAADFAVYVDNSPIPKSPDVADVQFSFPRDYKSDEAPEGLVKRGELGEETLPNGKVIKWRVNFYKDPIDDEELRGVAVFAKGKLAQSPFFFNMSGGTEGQHGMEYLAGRVLADYLDILPADVIATERQRINWEHAESAPLLDWGRKRVKELLRLWRERRGEARRSLIESKVARFSERLEKLPPHERRTVTAALTKLGSIPALSNAQFEELAAAILTSWEQGRLRNLIDEISRRDEMTADSLLVLLTEAEVLVALNAAEVIRTKLEAIRGLKKLVDEKELENKVRDYIAEKPYLLHPKWDTFKKEISVRKILDEAAAEAGLAVPKTSGKGDKYERKRIDLALRSNEHLLVVEFMKPGEVADYDHLSRCKAYVHLIRDKTEAQTALGIKKVTGLLVADSIEQKAQVRREVIDMADHDIHAHDWASLLIESERTWREFLGLIKERSPKDNRLDSL